MGSTKSVDEYIDRNPEWSEQLSILRNILLELPMEETIKWGGPVYTYEGKNVIGLGAFKQFCSIWFFQGVFLRDQAKVLVNAQEGVTKALRQWRFYPDSEIPKELVRSYALESIENQRLQRQIKPAKTKTINIPTELTDAIKANEALEIAFHQFSKAKQSEFSEFILEAKKKETRMKRIEKIIPMILQNKSLHEKYKL